MHTFGETGAGVPAFLAKLWRLVDDPDTNHLICWSKDGRSFIIQNQAQFARELLPLNYKHNNMASFIRQLNMYGFHKITSIDNGGLKFDRDEMEFSHPCFKRNCPYLLEHIKRKIANTKGIDEKTGIKQETVTKVLQDVKAMRGRQDSLDSRFSVMKQENESLWREIASLRQKHAKQQQIVNKLIQFLITIVQPSRNMSGVKRHMQLMINDTPDSAKLRKSSESESECGPVIHELGEELLDEVTENDVDLMVCHNTESGSPLNIERPHSSISMSYDYSNQSADDLLNAAASSPSSSINKPAAAIGTKNAAAAAANAGSSIIQSVCPDGSRIVYHVTEVPDSHPQDNKATTTTANSFNEENVLTTPMVREQMARTRTQLKLKNKQRHKEALLHEAALMAGKEMRDEPITYGGEKQTSAPQQQPHETSADNMRIKSEQELDPMMFLNVYPDSRIITPDAQLISPNISEDSRQSSVNSANMGSGGLPAATTPTNDTLLGGSSTSTDLYNTDHFITGDMPADIFEDSSLITGDNSKFDDDLKLNQQQKYGRSTVTGGKFSSYIAGNNNNNNTSSGGASTSAAAAANSNTTAAENAAKASTQANNNKNSKNMAVTKYNNKSPGSAHEDVMRLSSPDDVHGHLESVQDELETLKDLLRGDNYSLDANTLIGNGIQTTTMQATMFNQNNIINLTQATLDADFLNKLFNESDLLGPYGLSMSEGVGSNDKKGSELMTYQPIYDLSDIIDYNDVKNDLDNNADSNDAASGSRQIQPQRSTLNTPYHD